MATLMPAPLLRARPFKRPPLAAERAPGLHRIPPAGDTPGPRAAWARVPTDAAAPVAVAVMLHGSGGQPEQGLTLLEPFGARLGLLVVAPASRSYTWDGVLGRIGPDVEAVDAALRWVFERFTVQPQRLAIGGFSDGASYALALGVANGDLFSHVVALSPGFVPPVPRQGQARVFVSHGTRDRVLPIDNCSRRIVPDLRRGGHEVEYREFEGSHEIPEAVARAACEWLVR